jgi:hypothetical protein
MVSFTLLSLYPRYPLCRRMNGPPEPVWTLWSRGQIYALARKRTQAVHHELTWQSPLCCTSRTVERGIYNCKPAARIDLRGLRRNASLMWLTLSSEVLVFPGEFTHNGLPVILSLLSQKRMLFHVWGRRPYCVIKRRWTAVRDCISASHNTHWTCCCGIDIVTELVVGQQLAHAL